MAGTDDNLDLGGQLPPVSRGPSLADEEAAMHKGRGRMLVGLIAVAIAIAGGAGYLLSEGSQQQSYGEIGKKINGMKKEHFDQFWGCALPNENLRDIKTNADLESSIVNRAQAGANYGRHVRDVCMDKLAGIETKLDILLVPRDFEADTVAMNRAVKELRSGWSDYISYIVDPKGEYSEELAQPKIARISRAWYEFRKAHASVNATLIKKLNKN
jgi:hypothetical protein